MADPGVGFDSEGTPLEERPPMVVGYESTAQPQKESFWDRLPGRGGPSIGDRLLRTPIHREVTALVAAGAILLIGAALFLAQRSAGQETTQGEITSDAVDGQGARSNGLFGGLFGGGDDEDQAEESAGTLEVETSDTDASESQDAESETSESEDGELEESEAEQPSTSETAEDSESPDPTDSGPAPTSAPTTAEPTPTQPTPTEPPQTQVTQTERSTTQPPLTQSSNSRAPVTQAPTTRPPTTRPPTTRPPTTRPPTTEPPLPPGAGERYRNNLLPGRIQAEFFDGDGDGLAYNDTDDENFGNVLRVRQSVDVFQTNAGENYVGRTRSDEWLEYTVTVEDTGRYVIAVNVASNRPDPGRLGVFIDGEWIAGFDVPPTGSNGNWVELESTVKNIDAGVHVIRLNINDGGRFNIDWFALREA